MGTFFAVGVLLFILWIVFNLMRSAHEGETKDIVTGYYVWPGEFVETGRERKADGIPPAKPAKARRIELLGVGRWDE